MHHGAEHSLQIPFRIARLSGDYINVQRLVDMFINPFNKGLNNLLMGHRAASFSIRRFVCGGV
jgi:hypothetical protein